MLYPASSFLAQDPFALMRQLTRDLDRSFAATPAAHSFPAVNIWQSADAAAVAAELPGVDPDDIEITVKEDVLTLRGERKPPELGGEAVWLRSERGYGKFNRAVRLPFRVDPENVEARFRDGVLQIALHRPERDKPSRIQIKAG